MAAKKVKSKEPGPFGKAFLELLDELEDRAKDKGLNFTVLCQEAGVSRAGPVRWRHRLPHTIASADKLAAALDKCAARVAD